MGERCEKHRASTADGCSHCLLAELRFSVEAARRRAAEAESSLRDAHRWMWMFVRATGGEVRVDGELIDSGLDGSLERTDDEAARQVVFRASKP